MSPLLGIAVGMDETHSTGHSSRAFTRQLDMRDMLGERIMLDRGVCSLALHPVSVLIHL